MKRQIERLTFSEFMKRFRPDGKGHIYIHCPGDYADISFDEVVCDLCNAEIPPMIEKEDGTSEESAVYMDGDYALCKRCFEEIGGLNAY